MANILIFGAKGQLGQYLMEVFSPSHDVTGLHREHIDLTETKQIAAHIEAGYDLVINATAYTAVDKAESEEALAQTINADAPTAMAEACKAVDTPFIHFSTDYVFAGDAEQPYAESDQTDPQGVYGATKLAGEQAILDSGAEAYIFRTAWVYSQRSNNFYKTMLRLAADRDELGIVADQVGSPTYAGSIAEATLSVANSILSDKKAEQGVYHLTNNGIASWFDFAQAIFAANKVDIKLNGITTADFPTPAKRPAYSVLANNKLKEQFNVELPTWQQGLALCVAEGADA